MLQTEGERADSACRSLIQDMVKATTRSVYLDNALKHGCTSTAISSTGISNDDPSATKAPISEGHIKLAKDAADP